jgi:hypothetical protein
MRASRVATLLWLALIGILLIVEVAEITHAFKLPIQSAIGDPLAFVFALVFTTILALVGAIFIGIYFTQRILSPSGFTPFEEEMLRMRRDLAEVKESLRKLSESGGSGQPPSSSSDPDKVRP